MWLKKIHRFRNKAFLGRLFVNRGVLDPGMFRLLSTMVGPRAACARMCAVLVSGWFQVNGLHIRRGIIGCAVDIGERSMLMVLVEHRVFLLIVSRMQDVMIW